MRLYRGKVETIAEEILRTLKEAGDIDLENEAEAKIDIESVLKEYLRLDKEIVEEAKNRMEVRGLGYSNLGRVKSQVAKERGGPGQDDLLPYLLEQILNILFSQQQHRRDLRRGRRAAEEGHADPAQAHGRRERSRPRSPLEDQEPARRHFGLRDRVLARDGSDQAEAPAQLAGAASSIALALRGSATAFVADSGRC